jgi:hypothetical protein
MLRFQSAPKKLFHFAPHGVFERDPSLSIGVVEAKITQVENLSLDLLGQTALPFVFFTTEHLLYVLTPHGAYPIVHFPHGIDAMSVPSVGSSEFLRSVLVQSGNQEERFLIRISNDHKLSVVSTDGTVRPFSLNLSPAVTLPGIEVLLLKEIILKWSEKNLEIQRLGYGWFDKSELNEALGFIRLQVARLGVAPEVVVRLIATHSRFVPGDATAPVRLNLSQSLCALTVDENH